MDSADAYDTFEYRGHARIFAHPRRLEVLARLRGLRCSPVDQCRVLELGCGDGVHLLWVAASLPGSRCVGVDRSARALGRARLLAERAGLRNVDFLQADLAEPVEALEQFDYIVAHGLYSWVPPAVRSRVMELCGRHLAPEGVAMISFNAKPGFLLREVLGVAMRHHTRNVRVPALRVDAARRFAESVAAREDLAPRVAAVVRAEVERLRGIPDHVLFHDDLAEGVAGFSLAEFLGDAAAHGLRYLGEAVAPDARPPAVAEETMAWAAVAEPEWEHREMLLDPLVGRAFRRTLLCRAGAEVRGEADAGVVVAMSARGCFRPIPGHSGSVFEVEGGATWAIRDPLLVAAAGILDGAWPGSVTFQELLNEGCRRAGLEIGNLNVAALQGFLLEGDSAGILELELTRARTGLPPGPAPRAFALARAQAGLGFDLTGVHGRSVSLSDAMVRRLVELMDGRRDESTLVEELVAAVAAGRIEVPAALRGVADLRGAILGGLATQVQRLHRLGLLETRAVGRG